MVLFMGMLALPANGAHFKKINDLKFIELCKLGTVQDVIDAINSGANVNAKDENGRTALMWAAGNNKDVAVVIALLNHGAEVNFAIQDYYDKDHDMTALMWAAKGNKNSAIIKVLIEAGADVNASRRVSNKQETTWWVNETALVLAAQWNTIEIVNVLMEAGAKVSDRALLRAARNNTSEVIDALIKAGADINATEGVMNCNTVLMNAAEENTPQVVETLIKAGANVNDVGSWGNTALMIAAEKNVPEVAEVLIKAGAEVNARGWDGWTPLLWAAKGNKNPKMIHTLIEAGAEDVFDENGDTALMIAIENNTTDVVKALIEAGSDVNHKGKYGGTPLGRSIYFANSPGIIVALIKAGANVNITFEDGVTMLMKASQHCTPEVIDAFLDVGVNAKARDRHNRKAIAYALGNPKLKGTSTLRRLEVACR